MKQRHQISLEKKKPPHEEETGEPLSFYVKVAVALCITSFLIGVLLAAAVN